MIAESRASSSLSDSEVTPVLNDFVRREVLIDHDGVYDVVLPIFRLWLTDIGTSQLISDALSEELAQSVVTLENTAIVKSDEIVSLVNRWPTYCGRSTGTDEIRAWMEQVNDIREQRILFLLLQRTKFFSEPQIRERLRYAHSIVRPTLPEFVTKRKTDRRSDVLLTYVDGPGKSGANYASLYAEENSIPAFCVIAPAAFRTSFDKHVKENGPVAAVIGRPPRGGPSSKLVQGRSLLHG